MRVTRRALLCGAGASIVASALPFRAFAQTTGTTTVLGLTKNGYIMFPETVNGVALTKAQRAALGRIGTQIAQQSGSRVAAEATMSTIARTAIMGTARLGLYGLAAGVAIGGIYCLVTGTNPLDMLLNLTGAGTDKGVALSTPCSCNDSRVQLNSGSYPDTVTMGWVKNSSCTTQISYRISLVDSISTTSPAAHGLESGWAWAHTQNLANSSYRHFYTKTVNIPTSAYCGTEFLTVPGQAEMDRSLSNADKAKVLANSALDAMGISLWDAVDKARQQPDTTWTGGGFTGGGGGSFGGGGATGYWDDPAPAKQKANTKGAESPRTQDGFIKPLPVKGTLDDLPNPTFGDAGSPWTGAADPGNFAFPPEVKFPDDTPTGTPTPTPTPTPGSTPTPTPTPTPSGEGSDWTKWLPSMPTLGLPSLPDMSLPEMATLAAPTIAAPTFSATCVNPGFSFQYPTWTGGGIGWGNATLAFPMCDLVAAAGVIMKPLMVGGGYVVGAWRVMRRL